MKVLFTSIFLTFLTIALHAQFPDTAWVYNYGTPITENFGEIKQTTDSGFVIVGTTNNECLGMNDINIIKVDSGFNTQWSKVYGGTGTEWGYSVVQTFDGGYAFAGFTNSYGNGGYDGYLVRVNSWGNIIWTKTFGGTNWDFIYSLKQTSDSGFVLCGETYSFGSGGKDVYAIRTDKNGNTIWTNTFGGTLDDIGNKIIVKNDTSYAIIGQTNSFGLGNTDVYFLLIDSNGNLITSKTYGSTRADIGFGIDTTSDGGFVFAGITDSLNLGSDGGYIIKTDSVGNELWNRIYNGITTRDIKQVIDGGYVVSGTCLNCGSGAKGLYVMRLDGNGFWTAGPAFGGSLDEEGFSVINTFNGGLVFGGTTTSYGQGYEDIYLIYFNNISIVMNYEVIVSNYNDSLNCTTGINQPNAEDLGVTIFPNPSNGDINVSIPSALTMGNEMTFTVTDLLGKEVYKHEIENNNFIFRKKDLNSGTYFYIIRDENNNILSKGKIIFIEN